MPTVHLPKPPEPLDDEPTRPLASPLGHFGRGLMAIALVACNAGTVEMERPGLHKMILAEEPVPGHYVVVLNDNAGDTEALAEELTAAHNGAVTLSYRRALRGFAARLSAADAEAL